MTKKLAQVFTVWPESDPAAKGNYVASTPEDAAEYYAEDHWDGEIGEWVFHVEDEDGTVFGVTVDIQSKPVAFAKPAKKKN